MAAEIVAIGTDHELGAAEAIVHESLTLAVGPMSDDFYWWFEDYLGRRDPEGDYFRAAVVIGRPPWRQEIVLRRAEDYDIELQNWSTVVIDGGDDQEERVYPLNNEPYNGVRRGHPFFCWERPYRYFEEWMRHSLSLSSLDEEGFMRDGSLCGGFKQARSSYGGQFNPSGLLTCVSYEGIDKTFYGSYQDYFSGARTQSTNTAAAIAVGHRGRDLWLALALDVGAWMAVRPDIWPSQPSAPSGTIDLLI
ncbi:hypothetical protein DFH09DRAFT_1318146 [Mycena vulgaris]|nr:hypothetical protein DFH09DRAFT_1318146 [Mycena vulgaris]